MCLVALLMMKLPVGATCGRIPFRHYINSVAVSVVSVLTRQRL
jgi:hypothetical protein